MEKLKYEMTLTELHALCAEKQLTVKDKHDDCDVVLCACDITLVYDDAEDEKQKHVAEAVLALLEAASRLVYDADHLFHDAFDCR